jgi:hypothetical protein
MLDEVWIDDQIVSLAEQIKVCTSGFSDLVNEEAQSGRLGPAFRARVRSVREQVQRLVSEAGTSG